MDATTKFRIIPQEKPANHLHEQQAFLVEYL
jgi:hypothetical protein